MSNLMALIWQMIEETRRTKYISNCFYDQLSQLLYHRFNVLFFSKLRRACIKDMRSCFSQKASNSLDWLPEVEGFET